MKKAWSAAAGAVAVAATLGVAAPAMAAGEVISVDGVSKQDASRHVDILVQVQKGESRGQAKARALESQGAKPTPPAQSQGFTFTGLFWDVLPVVQNYNPAGQATTAAQNALRATESTWSGVRNSSYRIGFGGTTPRCPSLVRECAGPQVLDGKNDVGWARLGNGILGVTWNTSNPDEADMAISTRFSWSTGCTQQGSAYDLQTVFLHENGHVAGLGHSSDINAVMYPSYQTARCALGQDDINGISTLY